MQIAAAISMNYQNKYRTQQGNQLRNIKEDNSKIYF